MNSKRSMFSGCLDVFKFTFYQISKGKGFKIATYGITILFFIICFGINVGLALFENEDNQEISNIEKLMVINETDIVQLDFSQTLFLQETKFENLLIEESDRLLSDLGENEASLKLSNTTQGYVMEISISGSGAVTEDEANELLDLLEVSLEQYKYINSGIPMEKLTLILSPVNEVVSEVGEADISIGEMVIRMVIPMLLSFLLYFMLLYYGQSIGKILIAERSSKLMELLLVSVKPYAIVAGKILATAIIAIIQILLWITGAVSGFVFGDKVATAISSEYNNMIVDIIELIKNNTDSNAFSISIIIIAVIALCLGFMFYSVLAGLVYSNVKRPEELSNGTSIFVIFIIVGFFSSYLLTAIHTDITQIILSVLRYVPIVSPFILPADLIVGNIGLLEGLISMLIMIVCTFILILMTGRQYKKTLFSS